MELANDAATSDFVGIGRPIVRPLSDLTGGSWMTFVDGRLGRNQHGARFSRVRDVPGRWWSGFTTLVFERLYNDDSIARHLAGDDIRRRFHRSGRPMTAGGFCDDTAAGFCTLDEFKANYDNANITGLTVGDRVWCTGDDLVCRRRVADD